MTETELAWAAGLFEGEGNIRANKATRRNYATLYVSVTNTNQQIVHYFGERWGGTIKAVAKKEARHAQGYAWVICARQAARFLGDILPYLRTDRYRRRAKLGLRFQRQKSTDQHINCTPEYFARQEWYYRVFHHLNAQGAAARDCPEADSFRRKE